MSVNSSHLPSTLPARLGWALLNALQCAFTLLWTAFGILLAFVVLLLCGGRRHWPLRMASRLWAPGLLGGAGARLQVEGIDGIDFSRPYIVVANHQSMIDICALFRAIPVPLRFVMKRELLAVPFIGQYARAMGMVFIDRDQARRAARSLDEAGRLFAQGHSICAFPEGTRSLDGRVRSFKGGVFRLAIETGVPILPVAIMGSGAILPSSGFRVRPGTIRLRVGQPIDTTQLDMGGRRGLAEHSRQAVLELLGAAPIR